MLRCDKTTAPHSSRLICRRIIFGSQRGVVGNFVSRVRAGYDGSFDPLAHLHAISCRGSKSTSGHCPADGINYATAAAGAR